MTRWARSGSSQKHRKPPADPTSWEEFVSEKRLKSNSRYDHSAQNIETREQDKNAGVNTATDIASSTNSISKIKKLKKKLGCFSKSQSDIKTETGRVPDATRGHLEIAESQENAEVQQIEKSDPGFSKKKGKNKAHVVEICPVVDKNAKMSADVQEEITITKEEIRAYKKLMKKKKRKAAESVEDNMPTKKVKPNKDKTNSFRLKQPSETSLKELKVVKTTFLDRLKKKRADNGILLLPPKTEKRLYNMKRSLRNKGMPGENIREIVRNIRRKEELKFRKTLKTCFKCREMGHMLADCPLLKEDSEEGTGICFKCGSAEHTSYKCSIKGSDFPFAKCFICHEQGHLSRDCPKNSRGAYPHGGRCNNCGNINHLVKDCPSLQNKDSDEITVGTLTDMTSVEEIEDYKPEKKFKKGTKIVKF